MITSIKINILVAAATIAVITLLSIADQAHSQTSPRLELIRLSQQQSCGLARAPRVLNIAHRGNEREYMENSLPAFASAAELKADFVELDIVFTKDLLPLVYHDTVLDRSIINCGELQNSKVSDLTYDQIKTSCRFTDAAFFRPLTPDTKRPEELTLIKDVYTQDEIRTPPLLDEVIIMMAQTHTGLLIELKTYNQYSAPHSTPHISMDTNLQILDLLTALDPQGHCELQNTSRRRSRGGTFNCFSGIQLMSFHFETMDFMFQKLHSLPNYKNLKNNMKLLKLVGPSQQNIERLTSREHKDRYWNLDGVAFGYRFGENNTYDSEALDLALHQMNCVNEFSKSKLKYVWTAYWESDLQSLVNKPINGVVTSMPRLFPKPILPPFRLRPND